MTGQLAAWAVAAAGIALALLLGAGSLGGGAVPADLRGAGALVTFGGVALGATVVAALLLRRPLGRALAAGGPADAPSRLAQARPRSTLFVISFAALLVELLLIRYCGSQVRIFAFYKNVPLVGCFLGLGLGCCLGGGRGRHALGFLLWLIPLAAVLSQGAVLVEEVIGMLASAASSEHILGDLAPPEDRRALELASQAFMGLLCALTLVAITLLFRFLGRLLGDAFERVPRLQAYTLNIAGSLAGILGFVALSFLQTPPAVWFALGLLPLLWWVDGARARLGAAALIASSVLLVAPAHGHTVWSPYQKLVGFELAPGEARNDSARPAYLVQISGVFYQVAMDLRPESIAEAGHNPYPHYDAAWKGLPPPARVLVVGAGTGNDAAAALRAGAQRVDAVDIDPAIVELGRRHHPEHPYDDPRVHVIVDDARAAFRKLPRGEYDAVVFGLLDSHTQLGISSLRLDNYVFTLESFASARRQLRPGGHLIVSAATFRPWFRERLGAMVAASGDGPLETTADGVWYTWRVRVDSPATGPADVAAAQVDLPTDDWPFLYLPQRSVPTAYVVVLVMLGLASIVVLRLGGLPRGQLDGFHLHLFFLGAAFLLMEVYAINRLALLFGTTWIVSAVAIAAVLLLIVAANAVIGLARRVPLPAAYALLLASLAASWSVDPDRVLGAGMGAALGYALLALSPVFCSGLVFAQSFKRAPRAGPAMGANILGAVLGGWVEYSTMALGIRAMLALALVFYAASAVALLRGRGLAARTTTPVGSLT